MAEKTIQTKILLRYDVLSAWTAANPELKAGEVAIVAIPTDSKELNINGTTPPQILFKVGPGNFKDLPYASGKAADVYSWAKEASLSITKVGEGNVVSGIEWDAAANNGKGGIKFTTASVATSEELNGVKDRLTAIEGDGEKSRITLLEEGLAATDKLIADNKAAWEKDDNTTYAFEAVDKGFKVTPSVGEAQTFTFAYLTADEVASAITAYGYKDEAGVKAIVESYGYTTVESLNNYYTKTEIDNKGFLVASDIAGKADKSYVDEELAKKADASSVYTKTESDGKFSVIGHNHDDIYYRATEIDTKVEEINKALGINASNIEDLAETVGGLDTTVDGLLEAVEEIYGDNGEIKAIKGRLDKAEGKISTLEGHFGENGRVTVAEGKISTLETKVGNLSGAFQFKGTVDSVEKLPAASADNAGHVYVIGNKEYASDGSSWILLGDEGSYVLKTTYEAHLLAQEAIDQGQSDKIKAIEDDIKANRESWASKTSVTDPTSGDGKITVDGVEMVVYDDSALAGRVTTVEGKVKTLEETTIPTLATKEEVEVERERIDSIVNTTIPTLATKAEVKDALDNSHTHSNKDILDATTASFTTELKTKYDGYEGSISGVADRVTAVENEFKTVDGTKGKVVVLEEKVSALEAKPDITVTATSVSDGTNTFTKYDDSALAGRVKAVEDNFADWAIIWDCGGASNN